MEDAIPQPAMHGETMQGPTASGRMHPVDGALPTESRSDDRNAGILGKYAPLAGMSVFGFLMVMFYVSWKQQSELTNRQIQAAQEQVEKFYAATTAQHVLDRAAQTEQRTEDRKIRREELVEQKSNNEKLWQFTRELQLVLIEDSSAIKQLKNDNAKTVEAVRTNQQVIIELQKSLTGKKPE